MGIVCQTCIHHCNLDSGQRGICGARKNENGSIICENYGRVTAMALDPIEKKPLKMFYPGSMILSVGSYGCNLRCPFCQNHEISMWHPKESDPSRSVLDVAYISPRELADKAQEYRDRGNIGAAFTYNEPLVGWEYVRDAARFIKEAGMKNVLVTNGTASLHVLDEILPYIDAMNIDLKGFQNDYYKKLGGDLETVKEFIVRSSSAGCHVELTTLIVPGENDSQTQMGAQAQWIAENCGKDTPLHVTRFFPRYHMTDVAATNVQDVYHLANIAGKYLENVFVGNC